MDHILNLARLHDPFATGNPNVVADPVNREFTKAAVRLIVTDSRWVWASLAVRNNDQPPPGLIRPLLPIGAVHFFPQRACAAFLAMADRRAGDKALVRSRFRSRLARFLVLGFFATVADHDFMLPGACQQGRPPVRIEPTVRKSCAICRIRERRRLNLRPAIPPEPTGNRRISSSDAGIE